MKCSAELFVENMLDGAHPPFAHKGTHPGYFFNRINGFREYDYEVRVSDEGMVIFYPPAEHEQDPIPPTADSVVHFELPDRIYVLQRGLNFDFYNVLHIVPTGDTTCRVEWLTRQRSNEHFVQWCADEPKTLEQDRVLQESAQINYSREGADFERSVPADYATLLSRKIIHIARDQNWESARSGLVQRKLVRVRQ
ncbi:hypothetical protein ASF44_30370 [Pseudorhodoferax sp. Leaf274]|nr:hypothetical protein ASF44_30370 [Pseudorhodoferax sp. Leaf274]